MKRLPDIALCVVVAFLAGETTGGAGLGALIGIAGYAFLEWCHAPVTD